MTNDALFSRRVFLSRGAALLSAAGTLPLFLYCSAHAMAAAFAANPQGVGRPDHVLVIVQLAGGNDGLNTVVPIRNDDYSKARPRLFTRSFRTDKDAYDPVKLGWKITVLERAPDAKTPAIERRKVYDTTQPGRGNAGHTFGDALTEDERRAVIEYLKTL